MSDLSIIAHDYALNAEFARRFNAAVLQLKRHYLVGKQRSKPETEIKESRSELRQFLTSLARALDASGKQWTEAQMKVPQDVVERFRARVAGELPEAISGLQGTCGRLKRRFTIARKSVRNLRPGLRGGRCYRLRCLSAFASNLMASLLLDLLFDLRRRASHISDELEGMSGGLSPEFEAHYGDVVERTRRASEAVEDMLHDPDLSDRQLEPNFFIVFKRLTELLLNIEDSSLLILKRCSDADRLLSAILRRICLEVGYKDPPPLCGALSFQYFQALVGMDIVMTPQTQAADLLSLPDLYHELAHFVVFRKRADFEVRALAVIHRFFENSLRKANQQGLPGASLDSIRSNHALWSGYWFVEFVCDMIATFWCGPAYGWANLRLSATRGDPYPEVSTHPADDARRLGIDCMLRLIGESAAADQVNEKWEELKRLSPSSQPQGYTKRYPPDLLAQLASEIFEACRQSGFLSYKEQKDRGASESVLNTIDEAWRMFVRDAGRFPEHATQALNDLREACKSV